MPDVTLGPVEGGSRDLRAYLAVPADPAGPAGPAGAAGPPPTNGAFPGVVVIHEAFGLDDVLRRQADRLAAAGYLALAPDLFSDGGARRCLVTTFRAMYSGHGKPLADIDAARRHLLADERCSGRVGVIGFCMGGAFALLTASSGFDVASANYGEVPRHAGTVLAGACPVVGSYGGSDLSMRGRARKLERVLSDVGVEHDVKQYPGAGHSFLNDAPNGPRVLRPLLKVAHVGPDPVAAADAWARIETFFAEHLR